jgi:uncharacterized damage-inducible protein DinB
MSSIGKAILLDQLGSCQDDESWFVPLSVALDGLTAEQAVWQDSTSSNSIWRIVKHLTFWNERWLQRFKGTLTVIDVVDNDDTFDLSDTNVSSASWEAAVTKLNSVLSEWRRAISECSEDKLETVVPNYDSDAQWWALISNLATHNVYHIGQIVYVRKLQGSWEPRV